MEIEHFGRVDLVLRTSGVEVATSVNPDFHDAFRIIEPGSSSEDTQIVFDLMMGREVDYGEAVSALSATSAVFRHYEEEIAVETQYEMWTAGVPKIEALRRVVASFGSEHASKGNLLPSAPDETEIAPSVAWMG